MTDADPFKAVLDEPGPPAHEPRTFDHDDGSTYERVPSGEFPSFDEVDSTTIDDPGAPE